MQDTKFTPGSECRGFKTVAVTEVKSMKAEARQLLHVASGARILHIACPDRENCFCVAVPTPPPDDTGMPHILEHMTLAGSEKFRCKEPFFEMIKRSVATFINAMTGNDITFYPVCSTVKTDLFNLADVYFDAVFHPLLSEPVFHREAYHLAPADPAKPLGALRYDGIVYSEMKGVFSSPDGILERDSIRRLLPDTCHGKESGGNPESIPDLSLETLRQFHATRYHPSNAFIVAYGDIPTEDWLDFLAPRLAGYTPIAPVPPSRRQPKWTKPRAFSAAYPLPADEETEDKSYLMLNWLVGDTTDIAFNARLSILTYLLVGNDASPLKKAINDAHVGANVIYSGASANGLEETFHLGVDGANPEDMDAFRKVVFDTLDELSRTPFDKDDVDAAFQQVVYGCNEIGTNFALNTAANAAAAWCAGVDPASLLERMPYYDAARAEIDADPMLLPRMARELLVDNPHRLDIVLAPSHTIEKEQDAELARRLADVRAKLSDAEMRKISEEAAQLEEMNARPNSPEDLACLPRLKVADISPTPQEIPTVTEETGAGGIFTSACEVPTNGIVYLLLSFDLRGLPEDLWEFVPRFSGAVSDFGTKGLDYAAVAKRRASCTGSLSADSVLRVSSTPDATFLPALDFILKCTISSLDKALDTLREVLFELDPCDTARMADVIVQDRTVLRADFVEDARGTTRIHARRLLSLAGHRRNQTSGLPELALLERLGAASREAAYGESAEKIARIRDFLLDPRRLSVSLVAPEEAKGKIRARIDKWLGEMKTAPAPIAENTVFTPDLALRNEGLSAALQVSFSALCAPAPHYSSADAIPFEIGASIISSDYMLPEIRFKGNAYGAGLSYLPAGAELVFSTYRDPHVAESFETMMRAADFVKNASWTQSDIDNAILTSVKGYETPARPAAACTKILNYALRGVTPEKRAENYRRFLALKPAEVKDVTLRVVGEALKHAAYCVAASDAMLREAEGRIPAFAIKPMKTWE